MNFSFNDLLRTSFPSLSRGPQRYREQVTRIVKTSPELNVMVSRFIFRTSSGLGEGVLLLNKLI